MAAYLTFTEFKGISAMPPTDIDVVTSMHGEKRFADATALEASGESRFGNEVVAPGTLVEIILTPTASLDANDTDFATITVYARASGVRRVVGAITTQTTGTGDWAADIPIGVTISAADVAASDILTFAITKSGAGVLVPAFSIRARSTPNFAEMKIESNSEWIEDLLRKRYDVAAIAARPPRIVKEWCEARTTRDCYVRRGVNPGSGQDKELFDRAERAETQVREAADAKDGLFELPLISGQDPDAVVKGAPLGYSEESPYRWTDIEACAGRAEDALRANE